MSYGEKHQNPVSMEPMKGMLRMPIMHDPVQDPDSNMWKTEEKTPVR